MRYLLFLLIIMLVACETHSFESDKRQLNAKDEIRRQLHKARNFDITGFRQDTLSTLPNSDVKNSLRYTLDIMYTDSAGQLQKKKGIVLFTPDGKSVLNSQITDQQ